MHREERILDDYHNKVCTEGNDDPKFSSYYEDYDKRIQDIFSVWHGKIVGLTDFMNAKAKSNHHFNAGESRELLTLIDQISELSEHLKGTKYGFEMVLYVKQRLDYFSNFLTNTGGSHIPDDYQKTIINKYEPIFSVTNSTVRTKDNVNLPLKIIGEGAFAIVGKYTDPTYGVDFAVKQLKKTVTEREKARFKEEYGILSSLKSPYVLQVYSFDEAAQRYVMEYCDTTLKNYYEKNNNSTSFYARKRIAQQFLYAMSYLHRKKIFHRDLSYHNILLKIYDSGVLGVKLSDFGLVKTDTSDFTKTDTELKGTIIDPALDSFKNYSLMNEIYAIGMIINYIFSGRKNFSHLIGSKLEVIVSTCTNPDLQKRYKDVQEVLDKVDQLTKEDVKS